jgi:small subunit ribosomal protein S20
VANTAQTKKRARQNTKIRAHNHSIKSKVRTALKKVLKAIHDGQKEIANDLFKVFQKEGDKAARKNIFSLNKISRHKARLNKKIKEL